MYWKSGGAENTKETVRLALEAARELGIKHIVVSSNSGDSAMLLADKGLRVVCVTQVAGSRYGEISGEARQKLKDMGIEVLTTTHVLSGAERGISSKFGGAYPVEIIAHTLRMFGQGTKVAVEVAVMALDSGLIPVGEKIIALGGTSRGLDTALVLTPAHASNILDTRIHRIICKPE